MKPIRIYPALFLFVCLTGSCMETYNEEFPSLTTIIVQNPFFQKLETALIKSSLWLKLSNLNPAANTGEFALFGPTDEAIAAFEEISGTPINSISDTTLLQILSYHLVDGKLDRDGIAAVSSVKSNLGPELRIIKKDADIYVNGSKLLFTDVTTKNGNFHGLDKVLLGFRQPTVPTIKLLNDTKLLKSHSFSIMQRAIELTQLEADIWTNSTFLLPTDSAFQKFDFDHPDDLSSWSIPKIKRMVENHIFNKTEKFSSEFPISETSLSGNKIGIHIIQPNQWIIKEENLAVTAKPVLADIRAHKGVMHIIDQVIFRSQ